MEVIKNEEIFDFFARRINNQGSFGLHHIFDDKIKSNDDILDCVQSILKNGLENQRGVTIKFTVSMYGILPYHIENDDDKISNINNYCLGKIERFDRYNIVVAIPMIFENSNGNKIFGGWISKNSSFVKTDKNYEDSTLRETECLSDELFQKRIPKEMILGCYCVNKDDKNTVCYYENEKYYDKLTQTEKDEFIDKYFSKYLDSFDINSDNLIFNRNNSLDLLSWLSNQKKQYDEFLSNLLKFSKKDDKSFYDEKELNEMDLTLIDIERVKPTYDLVINSKYNIKDILLIEDIEFKDPTFNTVRKTNLAKACGFMLYNGKNLSYYVSSYELWVTKLGNNPYNNYKQWYSEHKTYFDNLFLEKLKERIKFALENQKKKD